MTNITDRNTKTGYKARRSGNGALLNRELTAMSEKPEAQAKKTSQNISSKPDDLVKGSVKGNVELTEDELNDASGGAIYMNWEGIDGQVTTQGYEKWIELNSATSTKHK